MTRVKLYDLGGRVIVEAEVQTSVEATMPEVIVWASRAYIDRGHDSRTNAQNYHEARTFVVGAFNIEAR